MCSSLCGVVLEDQVTHGRSRSSAIDLVLQHEAAVQHKFQDASSVSAEAPLSSYDLSIARSSPPGLRSVLP